MDPIEKRAVDSHFAQNRGTKLAEEGFAFGRIWRWLCNFSTYFYYFCVAIEDFCRSYFWAQMNEEQKGYLIPQQPLSDRSKVDRSSLGLFFKSAFSGSPSSGEVDRSNYRLQRMRFDLSESNCIDPVNEGEMPLDRIKLFSKRAETFLQQKDEEPVYFECFALYAEANKLIEGMRRSACAIKEGEHDREEKNWPVIFENLRNQLESKLCRIIKKNFTPNPRIELDGNCLFASISWASDGEIIDPPYYRELAAAYYAEVSHQYSIKMGEGSLSSAMQVSDTEAVEIEKKFKKIEDHINDIQSGQTKIKAQIDQYISSQGGEVVFCNTLKERLKREPNCVDYYAECLKNSRLWGGLLEIEVLSHKLNRPICIFSRYEDNKDPQNEARWKLLTSEDLTQDSILLFYSQEGHYQNLIVKNN